jgi:hypothetical protein
LIDNDDDDDEDDDDDDETALKESAHLELQNGSLACEMNRRLQHEQ